jgi:hypothetical protein
MNVSAIIGHTASQNLTNDFTLTNSIESSKANRLNETLVCGIKDNDILNALSVFSEFTDEQLLNNQSGLNSIPFDSNENGNFLNGTMYVQRNPSTKKMELVIEGRVPDARQSAEGKPIRTVLPIERENGVFKIQTQGLKEPHCTPGADIDYPLPPSPEEVNT